MIRSMTGFGRGQQNLHGRDITVEIRAVNHRYFEFTARIPRSMNYLEEKLKSLVQGSVARGKVEVGLTVSYPEGTRAQVQLNTQLADGYLQALRTYGTANGLTDDIALSHLMGLGDIFTVTKAEEDEEALWDDVRTAARAALEQFLAMRAAEGEKLRADVLGRLDTIEGLVAQVDALAPQTVSAYRARLYAKMQEVLADSKLEDQRILTEAAVFAERIATDEETVRLHSHIEQFRSIMAEDAPVGRKLDFLVQEMNRETNTIGSKAQDLEIARIVVEIKSEIEKIREQIQNME